MSGHDQAEGLRELASVTIGTVGNSGQGTPGVIYQITPDKSALWETLKSELEAETEGDSKKKYQRLSTQFGPKSARAMLDRMLQMETLAVPR